MASRKIEGRFFNGHSSAARAARLWLEDGRIALEDGEGLVYFPLGKCKVSERLGKLPRTVDFPGGGRFETGDHGGIDGLFPSRPWVGRLEGSWRTALGSAAAFVGILAACYFLLLPLFSREIAEHVPARWKNGLSAHTKAFLEKSYLSPSALGADDKKRAERLFAKVGALEPGLTISLRKSEAFGANAFALPDGTIYVTDDLFRLAKNDEELLAVLFHEAAHVRLNHSTAEIVANSVLTLALFTVAGGDFTTLPLVLLGSSYSRAYEEEADFYSAKRLRSLGLAPAALGRILLRMEKEKEKYPKYFPLLSSHPATEARVKKLETF